MTWRLIQYLPAWLPGKSRRGLAKFVFNQIGRRVLSFIGISHKHKPKHNCALTPHSPARLALPQQSFNQLRVYRKILFSTKIIIIVQRTGSAQADWKEKENRRLYLTLATGSMCIDLLGDCLQSPRMRWVNLLDVCYLLLYIVYWNSYAVAKSHARFRIPLPPYECRCRLSVAGEA